MQTITGLVKKFIQILGKILQKNPNELFGQPNIYRMDK